MKYNIAINQAALAETSLDLIDAAILDYLYFYCNSANSKIEAHRLRDEEGGWTWVDYGTLLKDMPLLRINDKGAVTRRVQKIEAEGYISTKRDKHQKLLFKINSKHDELLIAVNRGVAKNQQSYSRKSTNNNTIDNATKIQEIATPSVAETEIRHIIFLFKDVNPAYKGWFSNKTERGAIVRLLQEHGKDKLVILLKALPKIIEMPFAPRITSLYELEKKMGHLKVFLNQERNKTKQKGIQVI